MRRKAAEYAEKGGEAWRAEGGRGFIPRFGTNSRRRDQHNLPEFDNDLHRVGLLFREVADYGQLIHLALIRFHEQDDPDDETAKAH
jgi:hypothetical protein